jgi:hypothetical protein
LSSGGSRAGGISSGRNLSRVQSVWYSSTLDWYRQTGDPGKRHFAHATPPTIFFAIGFNLIIFTQRTILADDLFQFVGLMVATVAALVVGKAVLLANAMPFLKRFDNAPLIQPILFKTVVYWAFVFIARLLEGYIHYMIDERRMVGFFRFLLSEFSWHRFVFVQTWILILFLIYTTGVELNRYLAGGLFHVLFTRRN